MEVIGAALAQLSLITIINGLADVLRRLDTYKGEEVPQTVIDEAYKRATSLLKTEQQQLRGTCRIHQSVVDVDVGSCHILQF